MSDELPIIAATAIVAAILARILPKAPVEPPTPRNLAASIELIPFMIQQAAYSDLAVQRLNAYLGGDENLEPIGVLPKRLQLDPPQPVTFKLGEPTRFADYDGQAQFVFFLEKEVKNMQGSMLSRPQLFVGPPGLGKTTLAKIVANEISLELMSRGKPRPDFIYALGTDYDTVLKMDELIRRASARPGTILFVDEVHTLTAKWSDKWLLLLDEHRWKFEDAQNPVRLNDFTILGATTDYGALHGAFHRRFAERQLQPLSEQHIVRLLRERFTVSPEAAALAASRTHHGGAPWEGIAMLTEANVLTTDRGGAQIEVEDVQTIFRVWDVDAMGLKPLDRAVIKGLLTQRQEIGPKNDKRTVFAANEDATVAMARVDKNTVSADDQTKAHGAGLAEDHQQGPNTDRPGSEFVLLREEL